MKIPCVIFLSFFGLVVKKKKLKFFFSVKPIFLCRLVFVNLKKSLYLSKSPLSMSEIRELNFENFQN